MRPKAVQVVRDWWSARQTQRV